MHRLHRVILGLVIIPLALASCANASNVMPGEGGTAGDGSDGSARRCLGPRQPGLGRLDRP